MNDDRPSAPFLDGWMAHKQGHSYDADPYNKFLQPYSFKQWLVGWSRRYDAVKHDRDLSYDEMEM